METGTTPGTARQAVGGWRRVWCVLQDSAISFFGHERAALDGVAEPIETIEWLHIRAITLRPIAPSTAPRPAPNTPPTTAPGTAAREHGRTFEIQLGGASAHHDAALGAGMGAVLGAVFELQLGAGRSIAMRVETAAQRALWVRILADDLLRTF